MLHTLLRLRGRSNSSSCGVSFLQRVLLFAATASVLCTAGLCDDVVEQLNLTLTQPTTVWSRTAAVDAGTPNAPNLVVSQTTEVIVEYRINESTYDMYLRGLNISTGNILWTKGMADVCSEIQFIDTFGDDVHFIMGCLDHFRICSMVSGATTLRVDLPSNVTLAPLSSQIASQSYSLYTVVNPKRFVILSVVSAPEGVGGNMTYGSMLFSVATAKLTTSTLIEPCPMNVMLANVLTAPGEPGYAQVCESTQISYVSFNTSARTWRNINRNASMLVAATVAGGASLANVAVAYANPVSTAAYVAVFDVRNSQGMPLWTTATPEGVVVMGSTGETVFAVSNNFIVAFDGTSGTLLWNRTGFDGLQPAVLVDAMLSASAFFLDDIYIYQLDAQTGDTMASFDASFDTLSPAFAIAVPLRRYVVPLDSNEVVIADPQWFLAIAASEGLVLWNCTGASCEGATQIQGGVLSPPQLVQIYAATAANELAMLVQTSDGISALSLTVGWQVEEAYYAGTQDGVVFLTTANVDSNGFAAALDRNGRTLWATAAPFSGFSDLPTPFVSNVVFTTIDEATITAINTYNGSILQTLRLSSDCFSNGTQPLPSNVGGVVVPDGTHSNAYFVAALPCLFRIQNDLTLHTILLPIIASVPPVIDDDNGLAYLSTGNQIYTVSIPLGLTSRLLFTTDFAVTGVFPSSAWSAPANLRQGRNTLIYVTTTYSLHAIDVVDQANTLVWTLPAPSVSSVTFYNNSLYFFSPSMGVCRCSLDVTLSPANRVMWCAGAAQAATIENTIPQITVLPNGVLVALLEPFLLAVDATTGRPRWTLSGVISISTNSYDACPSMVFDPDHYIVFISCSYGGIVAVDALHSGHILYTLNGENSYGGAMLSYFGSMLFAASTGTSGVAGYAVPPMFSNRVAPSPQATTEPMVETLPPGFVPLPQPEPTAGPYPPSQVTPQVFTKASIVDGDAVESGSALRGGPLFPDIMFLTPISVGEDYYSVYVQAFNTTSSTFFWSTVADGFLDLEDSGDGCSFSTLCGSTAETSVFVFLCAANIYAFDAYTGANLWNTTASSTYSLAAWTPAPGDGGCVVLGVGLLSVITYDGATGAELNDVPLVPALAGDDNLVAKMFYPSGKNIAFLVVSGTGLQVIQLGPHRANATTTFDVAPGNGSSTPDAFCSANWAMVAGAPADPSASDGVFLDTDAAYFACMHGVMAHYVAVFRVDLLLSQVAVVRNISIGASTGLYTLQVDSTNTATPQIYILLDALVYRIDAASGTIAWIAAGNYAGSLGLSNDLVLVAATAPSTDYQVSPIVAYNKSTGAYLWNVSTTLYQSVNVLRIVTYDVRPGYVLIGAEGVYAVQYTPTSMGSVLWASQPASNGWVRSIDVTLAPSLTMGSSGSGQGNTSVLQIAIAFLDSTNTYVHVALAPAGSDASMVTVDATASVAYMVQPDASGNPFQLLVVAEGDGVVSALSYGWTALVEDALNVAEVSIADAAGGASVPVAVVFASAYVALFHLQSGQALGTYFFTDACLGTVGSSGYTALTEVGGSLYFTDKSCVYQLDVAKRTMRATLLSAEGSLNYGVSTSAMTSDNATLFLTSTYGAVYSIAIPTLAVNWINDAMQFIALESITGLLLPSYDASVPKASQQLLGFSANGVASFSAGTGQVAWVYLSENTITASLTYDGHVLVVSTESVSKINISTAVPAMLDRVLWTVPFGATITNDDTLFCINHIPQSDVVVLMPSTLLAVEVSTGAVIWNVSVSNAFEYDCLAIEPVVDPRTPSQPATLLMLVGEYESISLLDARTGNFEYTYGVSPSEATVSISNGWAAISTYDSVMLLPLLFATAPSAPPLPPAVYAAPATIPTSYVFPPPDLNSSSTTVDTSSAPIPLTLWSNSPLIPSDDDTLEVSIVLASEIQGQDVLIQAYSYYYYQSSTGNYVYASQMRIVHALSGVQLHPIVSWPACELTWFVALSSKVALAYCPNEMNSEVALRFIDTTSPALTTLAALSAPSTRNGFRNTPSVVQVPDFGLACIYTTDDLPFLCFGTNPSNRSAFGTIVYQFTCPDKLAGAPAYDAMHQLLLIGCRKKHATTFDLPTANAIVAVSAETGSITWNATFGVAEVTKVAFSANFGVAMLTGKLPNVTAGNFTIQAISLATGAMTTPMFDAIPDQDPAQVANMFVVERSITPVVDLGVIFVTPTKTIGYSTHKAQIIWDVYTGGTPNADTELLIAAVMGVDPVANVPTVYVVSALSTVASLFAIDALASFNNELYVLQIPYNSDYAPLLSFITHGMSMGLLVNLAYELYYVDLVSRTAPFAVATGYNTVLSANLYLRASPGAGYDLVLDYSGSSGNVYQFLLNTTNATTALVNNIAPVALQLATGGVGAEYLVGVDAAGSTFLFDATGKFLWGTATTINTDASQRFGLAPQLVQTLAGGHPVLVTQFAPRTFYVYDGEDGSIRFAGYLPLCNGKASDSLDFSVANVVGSVTDVAHDLVYLSVLNPCLYTLNLVTGSVQQTVVPQAIPLLQSMTMTASCVIVMDAYGGVMCFPRGASLAAAPRWTFRLGYTSEVGLVEVTAFGSLLLVSNGDELVCLTETVGQLVWRQVLGPRLTFITYNQSTVVARTWHGVYVMDVDPALQPSQRVQLFVSTVQLFGKEYLGGTNYNPPVAPIVTANGNVVVVYGSRVFGIKMRTGAVAFQFAAVGTPSALSYSPESAPLNRVFFVTANTLRLHSVVDGTQVAAVDIDADEGATTIVLLASTQRIVFKTYSTGAAQVQPIPDFITSMVPPFTPVTVGPAAPFTLPPNYVPQGEATPMPTLAPGVTLPVLSCVLNIEALYGDLVTCVNSALTHIYANRSVNAILCMAAAARVSPCVDAWLTNVIPDCPGAVIYLNNVLTSLNQSSTFNFCGSPSRCSDGTNGSAAVCAVVNAALAPSGGATFAPQLQLPQPANKLPDFTAPSNTVTFPPTTKPVTTIAPSTTMAPTATSTTTATPVPGPTTTMAPGATTTPTPLAPTTAAPVPTTTTTTTTMAPGATTTPTPLAPTTAAPVPTTTTTTTMAPAVPTTTVAPSQQYIFTCVLPFGHSAPATNFAAIVGLQIGLTGPAPIALSQVTEPSARQAVGLNGPTFTFVFTGDSAAPYSQLLFQDVQHNAAAVAQSLGLSSISGAPYTPQQGGGPAGGMSSGAVAGIVITLLVVAAAGGFVAFRYWRRTGGLGRRRQATALRGAMIQEEDGYGGTNAANSSANILSRREMGDVSPPEKGGSAGAPIYSSM